uniref:Uncharacterized protein n=1 Tax=Octopus bimaculoides TaxID=37653 RepID=A0A0L8I6S4_OCTBM
MRCLRTISNIKPIHHIHNSKILRKCNISSIEVILIKIQVRLSDHLSRMSDIRIPSQLLFGKFPKGRSVGLQRKLKNNLKRCNIPFPS